MQQIADWLQKLGLGQYAERFADNDINFAILPDLQTKTSKNLEWHHLVTVVSSCAL
jgi:hypothetical protein